MAERFDVAIIGAGLAGLSAALYSARLGINTIVLERQMAGGQVINVERIETFPGFSDGISGAELGAEVQVQAERAGAEFRSAEVLGLNPADLTHQIQLDEGELEARAVIVAAGSSLRNLSVPGEEELLGRGVSHCASCDGPFFTDQAVAVVGGGDSALDEALVLTEYASEILIFHRREQFRAQEAVQKRVIDHPKVSTKWNSVIESILGDEEVKGVRVRNTVSGEVNDVPVTGVFIYAGLEPNTRFLKDVLPLDGGGHIPVNLWMETSVPGIFAAGDLRQHSARQLASAAGDGVTAAFAAWRYLKAQI